MRSANHGVWPSTTPQANNAAMATAGNFMGLFATSQAFRCDTSEEKDRTDAFRLFHTVRSAPQFPSVSAASLSVQPNLSPRWMDRRKGIRFPRLRDRQVSRKSRLPTPHEEDPAR